MNFSEILLRGLSGAILVIAATLLAEKYKSPYLGGLAILFPAITLTTIYFVGKSIGNEQASKVALGMLFGFPVWLVYVLSLFYFLKNMKLISAILASLFVWILGGIIFIYFRTRISY